MGRAMDGCARASRGVRRAARAARGVRSRGGFFLWWSLRSRGVARARSRDARRRRPGVGKTPCDDDAMPNARLTTTVCVRVRST
jgi:hypothetical protein